MLIIHRVISPEEAKRIRSIWERMGAVKAESKREAICIEREGKLLVFVDETNNGQNCLPQEKRAKLFDLERLNKWPETYEVRYIQPKVTHLCGASKVWNELRVEAAEEAISIDASLRTDGPYWARMVKESFLTGTVPKIIDKHESMGDCSCEKGEKIREIEELLKSLEEIDVESHQIDNLYTGLERLLDLKVPELLTI